MSDDWAAFRKALLGEVPDWHVFDCSGMPRGDGPCCEAQEWLERLRSAAAGEDGEDEQQGAAQQGVGQHETDPSSSE